VLDIDAPSVLIESGFALGIRYVHEIIKKRRFSARTAYALHTPKTPLHIATMQRRDGS